MPARIQRAGGGFSHAGANPMKTDPIDKLLDNHRFIRDLDITPSSAGYRAHRHDWYMFLFSTLACIFWLIVGVVIGHYLI